MRRGRHRNAVTARLDRTLAGAALFTKARQKKRFLLCLARHSLYVFFPGLAPRASINHSFPFLREALCRAVISANKILSIAGLVSRTRQCRAHPDCTRAARQIPKPELRLYPRAAAFELPAFLSSGTSASSGRGCGAKPSACRSSVSSRSRMSGLSLKNCLEFSRP